MTNSSSIDRHDPNSEILELESIDPHSEAGSNSTDRHLVTEIALPVDESRQKKGLVVVQPLTISSTGVKFDIKAELDSLVNNLKLTAPQPLVPNLDRPSIDESLAQIAAAAPITLQNQHLLHEIQTTSAQIANSHAEIQSLHQRSQSQVEAVDASVLQVKELKFRTQQLARHSKNQICKVQEMLTDLEQIRTEVVTGLDKFGGYAEIHSMLVQLADTRHELVLAHDRLKTGQEAFYDSLRSIQERAAATNQESEQKLREYHESISSLTNTISADRSQLAATSVEMNHKLIELGDLSTQITTMHGQVVERSQALQSNITKIDLGFAELSRSVQKEKEQFYELTAETIDKADLMRGQFTDIAHQISLDRDAIETLKSEIEAVRCTAESEARQQLIHFDSQYHNLMETWGELAIRQKTLTRNTGRFSTWLLLLSFAVGVIFVLLITILLSLR